MKENIRKTIRKTIITAALAASLTGMLGACGSKSGTSDASSDTGETVLEFPCIWVGTDSKAEVFAQIVNDFNTEYDGKYQVNITEYTDYDAYADYIRTTISAGKAPDLFSVKTLADVELYSSSGKILELTDFLARDEIASRYPDGVIESSKVDGANYALPWEAAIIPVVYNGTLLDAAGVTELPSSYDEFIAVLDQLKASGVSSPLSYMTSSNAWTTMLWYSFALGENGGSDVLNGEWDTDTFVKAAEIIQKLYEYAPSDAIGAAAADVNSHFFNNETAVYTNGTWILSNIQENAAEGIYDNLKFSAGPGNSIIQYTQAFVLAGATDDENKKAAVEEFLTWITDAERLTNLSNASGSVFAVKTNEVDNAYINEIIALRDNADVIVPSFESAVSTTAANDFSTQLESLLNGDISAEDFVSALSADNQE